MSIDIDDLRRILAEQDADTVKMLQTYGSPVIWTITSAERDHLLFLNQLVIMRSLAVLLDRKCSAKSSEMPHVHGSP